MVYVSPCTAFSKNTDVAKMARAGTFDVVAAAIGVARSKRSVELTIGMIAGWLRVVRGASSPFYLSLLEGIVEFRVWGFLCQRGDWF